MKLWRAIRLTGVMIWGGMGAWIIVLTILGVIGSLSSLVTSLTIKEVLDAASGEHTLLGLSIVGVVLARLGYEIFRTGSDGIRNFLDAYCESKMGIYLQGEYVDKIASLDFGSFENPEIVGLINRVFSRLNYQIRNYYWWLNEVVTGLVQIGLVTGIFMFESPLWAGLLIVSNLLPVWAAASKTKGIFFIYRADDNIRRQYGYTSEVLTDKNLISEVKLYKALGYFRQKLVGIYKVFIKNQLGVERRYQIYISLAELAPILAVAGFTLYLAQRLNSGAISTGTFAFLLTNVLIFTNSLGSMGRRIANLVGEAHYVAEIDDFFQLKPTITYSALTEKSKLLRVKIANPEIRFENVSFEYPSAKNKVLSNINFTIPYGQNLALVGENGAGKTTLVKLLMRIYDPSEGRILINGIDLKEIPEEMLFGLFSTLFQNFGRFNLTIRENLEMAAGKKLSEIEMKKYLKFSNAWEFVEDFVDKTDQQLGTEYEKGTDLSTGQWQRLAIARAYAKKAPILILDEPTSAVDARSEMEIFDRINREMEVNTLMFISHRFSTIKDAERIIVLDKGKIVEDGRHEELMANNGKYYDLYTIQAARYMRK